MEPPLIHESCYVYTWPAIFINGHFNLSVFKNNIVHSCQFSEKCSFTRTRVYMPSMPSRARQTCRWRCNEKLKPTLANQNPDNSNNSNQSRPLSLSRLPKPPFVSVYMQTCKQSFPKSPLWPEFLEIIVFCDKNGQTAGKYLRLPYV